MAKAKHGNSSPIVTIAEKRDVERVKAAIFEKYGFWVTDKYALDLIAFVDELTAETVP